MITALLITAAYAIPAIIARKRKMGFAKGLLYSLLLTPLVAIPVALLSKKKVTGKPVENTTDTSSGGKTLGKYGYDPQVKTMPDAWVLKEGQYASWNTTVSDTLKVPAERQHTIKPSMPESKGMKMS